MTEALSHPETESPEIQEDDSFEGITARYGTAQKIIEEIKTHNGQTIEGRSSLADVTGNLEAVVGSNLRYFEEDEDPEERAEDLEEARKGITALEAYLESFSDSKILSGELTETGADPALREAADQEALERHESAIQIYAHKLAEKARRQNETDAAER